jgi:chemotaxis protein MotA
MKMLRTEGPVAGRAAYRGPADQLIFAEYPKLLKDKTLVHLICDTLRLVGGLLRHAQPARGRGSDG